MKKPRVKVSREVLDYIDPSKKVRIYRNLHKKCFSVKQNNLVLVHADSVSLEEVKFIVSKAGQKRVRDEKKKSVHAFIEGYVVDACEADKNVDGHLSDSEIWEGLSNWESVVYNPYIYDEFTHTETGRHCKSAKYCDVDVQGGILSSGTVFMKEPLIA